MFWPHTLHLNGLVGQKNLNCRKKDQISVHSLLVIPFCGEIMHVLTCGVPHST